MTIIKGDKLDKNTKQDINDSYFFFLSFFLCFFFSFFFLFTFFFFFFYCFFLLGPLAILADTKLLFLWADYFPARIPIFLLIFSFYISEQSTIPNHGLG